MISMDPLCEGCPYIPGFGTLLEVMQRHGGRDAFVVTGESGCMIRAQVSAERILDTKFAMGSSIGIAAGIARSGIPQKVVALGEIRRSCIPVGAAYRRSPGRSRFTGRYFGQCTAAISGGQPHAAVGRDLRGNSRKPVDLVALVRAAGVQEVCVSIL